MRRIKQSTADPKADGAEKQQNNIAGNNGEGKE